jgi:GNAT superfamily N-acetyltransferase
MGLSAVTLREATWADQPLVLGLAAHFLEATRYGQLFVANPAYMARLFEACLKAGVIVVAEVDGQAVGFLALIVVEHLMSGEQMGEELAWWVEPTARRGKVGRLLLSAAEEWLAGHGVGVLKMVAPAWSRVGHTYERWGFEPVETAYLRRLETHGDVRRTSRPEPAKGGGPSDGCQLGARDAARATDSGAGPGHGAAHGILGADAARDGAGLVDGDVGRPSRWQTATPEKRGG